MRHPDIPSFYVHYEGKHLKIIYCIKSRFTELQMIKNFWFNIDAIVFLISYILFCIYDIMAIFKIWRYNS